MVNFNQARRRLRLIIMGGLLLAGANLSQPARAADAYDLHIIIPLTGNASFLGQEEHRYLKLLEGAVNRTGGINGRPLHLVFHDDQTNPQIAVQTANEVLGLHRPVFLGPSIAAECNAIAPILRGRSVMYCFSPGIHPAAGSFVFSSSASTYALVEATIRYFRHKGWTRLAVISSIDASGQDGDKAIKQMLSLPENRDVKLVTHQHFNPTDISVSAQIERIKAVKPQALIAWTTGAGIATIFKGIIQSGLDIPLATTNGNQNYVQLMQYTKFLPKQLYFPSSEFFPHAGVFTLDAPTEATQHEMLAALKAAGVPPDNQTGIVWDPLLIVVTALRKLGVNATPVQIRDYIAGLTHFSGINGVYDFKKAPQRGLSDRNVVMTRWNSEKKRWDWVAGPRGVPLAK